MGYLAKFSGRAKFGNGMVKLDSIKWRIKISFHDILMSASWSLTASDGKCGLDFAQSMILIKILNPRLPTLWMLTSTLLMVREDCMDWGVMNCVINVAENSLFWCWSSFEGYGINRGEWVCRPLWTAKNWKCKKIKY